MGVDDIVLTKESVKDFFEVMDDDPSNYSQHLVATKRSWSEPAKTENDLREMAAKMNVKYVCSIDVRYDDRGCYMSGTGLKEKEECDKSADLGL